MSNTVQHQAIASRYAEAVYAWAKETKSEAVAFEQLQQLEGVFADLGDSLYGVMTNPTVRRQAKHELMEAALVSVDAHLKNLVQLLVEHDRFGVFPEVVSTYQGLLDKQEKRVRGEVITATPIGHDLLNTMAEQLKKSAGYTDVDLINTVDESILGGAVLQLGDQRIDGSFATQMKALVGA